MATSVKERIYTQLNELNTPFRILSDRTIRMGSPVLNEEGPYNTRLNLKAQPGRGYIGDVDVYFDRVPLKDLVEQTELRSQDAWSISLIVQLIQASAGIPLSTEDFEPFEAPVLQPGESQQLTVKLKEGSLGYYGDLTLDLLYGKPWLDTVIGSKVLGVQNHPVTFRQEGYPSLRQLTWAVDFTCVRDALVVNKSGTYTDFGAVQQMCQFLNIPAWSPNRIGHYDTKDVKDANPAFDRVVIQSRGTQGPPYGDVYLHYNLLDEV